MHHLWPAFGDFPSRCLSDRQIARRLECYVTGIQHFEERNIVCEWHPLPCLWSLVKMLSSSHDHTIVVQCYLFIVGHYKIQSFKMDSPHITLRYSIETSLVLLRFYIIQGFYQSSRLSKVEIFQGIFYNVPSKSCNKVKVGGRLQSVPNRWD